MSSWNNINLQNSNSPLMEQLIFFHDHCMVILTIIVIFVGYLMMMIFFYKDINKYYLAGQTIEIIWTILPGIILIFVAFPSLRLLYLLDEISKPLITLKAVGHQWYWSYEYSNFFNLEFDSYMLMDKNYNFRLLEVDNNIIIPNNFQTRILTSAMDVLHSWTIPSLGIKVDAVPGRLNQTNFFTNRTGVFFGQCSEICGANHSFMPIVLESTSLKNFLKWLKLNN